MSKVFKPQIVLFAVSKGFPISAESAESAVPADSSTSEREMIQCEGPTSSAESTESAGTADSAKTQYWGKRLPGLLSKIVSLGSSPQEKELLLLAGITTLSVCFPTVSGIYGDKRYWPNIFFMAVGPAASGKGKMNLCRSILLPLHDNLQVRSEGSGQRKMLLIPANSSATAFQEILSQNPDGCIIFETEGDTLTDTFGQDYGNYSSCFRAAFEHEMISYARREKKEHVEIKNPKLSVLLSGTPNQVVSLIKDTENGLFSRFAFYRLEATDTFHVENNSEDRESKEEKCLGIGEELLKIYYGILEQKTVNYKMSNHQWGRFNRSMNSIKEEYFKLYDKDQIRASIWRLGVIRFRISMLLTVINAFENDSLDEELYCDDDSFEIAEQISRVLAEHMTQVYRLLPMANRMNKHFSTESEKQLYESLPNQFRSAEFSKIAGSMNLNPRTVERYLTAWAKDGIIVRLSQGLYAKRDN